MSSGGGPIRCCNNLLDEATTVALEHFRNGGGAAMWFNSLQRHWGFTLRASRPARCGGMGRHWLSPRPFGMHRRRRQFRAAMNAQTAPGAAKFRQQGEHSRGCHAGECIIWRGLHRPAYSNAQGATSVSTSDTRQPVSVHEKLAQKAGSVSFLDRLDSARPIISFMHRCRQE